MTDTKKYAETPLMKQYYEIKRKHPDAVLLFRVGDFYETFGEDAIKSADILGITLTKRSNGAASFVELAGFPYHALDTYLPKLVRAGQRVAICEQLEDPKLTKKIVKRGITELVTPGVSYNDTTIPGKQNNFLASIHLEKNFGGIAFLDISTGEFLVAEGNFDYLDKLISSFEPKEILIERSKKQSFEATFGSNHFVFKLDDWIYTEENAKEKLLKHFETKSLKGFGVHNIRYGIIAAGAIMDYLEITEHKNTNHISKLSRIEEDHYVWLDKFTIRNLELVTPLNEGAKTLLGILDKTQTAMGSRMLRRWIVLPLKNIDQIKERQNITEFFIKEDELRSELRSLLNPIGDLERLASKASTGRINPREVLQLKNALEYIQSIKELLSRSERSELLKLDDRLNACSTLRNYIEKHLSNEAPLLLSKGNVIKNGVHNELDELRTILHSGKSYIRDLQERESEKTGITSLKIGFNNVFGYYIEVRNTHKDKVPQEWIRKQTLVSAERYITQELKEYESKVLGAEEKILEIESALYTQLILSIAEYISALQMNAQTLATIDCLLSFSIAAIEYNYTKPELNDSKKIIIKNGRHPVIEQQLPIGEKYIANDLYLDNKTQQIIIITGPNMVGKSALLRQTALIVLMAQTGCFVPADEVHLGYIDRIFTRVGASDNISSGESTFMVEMNESANILNNISERSLVLLDEIGRGTSTYDGISIAWAMVEYLHEYKNIRPKTLFATHYHELNEMENTFNRVKNFNVSVKEVNQKIIFLRKLIRGGSEHSFGIHVAKLAGMPNSVVKRANDILAELEKTHSKNQLNKPVEKIANEREGMQLSIFQLEDPVLKQIRDEIIHLDINNLTPVEALNKLNEIKKISGLP